MIVLLAIALSFGPVVLSAGCPTVCNCTTNSVNCVSKDLEFVPHFENLANSPMIIDLSGNSITIVNIDDFSFEKSDQVIEIYLNNSAVAAIEDGAFDDLENLQELYLSNNLLNSLPSNIISNNENMILLDLSRNYFTEMPKIESKSLELLMVAQAGISRIPTDALDGLPNLRTLLLPQNNLQIINPVIFESMSNLFFVGIAHNPWKCSCLTMKLFDYLMEKRIVDLSDEKVQCVREDRIFVDIYSDKGAELVFKEECSDFEGGFSDEEEKESFAIEIPLGEENVTTRLGLGKETVNVEDTDFYINIYFSIILAVCIALSLVIGAISGSYVTFRFLTRGIRLTESQKELVPSCTDKEVVYSFA